MLLHGRAANFLNTPRTSLLNHFNCQSVKARFIQTDMKFRQSVLHGRLDCQSLVSMFPWLFLLDEPDTLACSMCRAGE